MAIQFREGSYAEKIIKNIAMVGEFPYSSLYLMKENDRINKRTVLNLRKESYITVNGSGSIKTIRLTTKAFPIIDDINPLYLEHYYSMSDNHHFRGAIKADNQNIWRKHRVAEVYMMMNNINSNIWKGEKPALELNKPNNIISLNDKPLFYDSVEVKNVDDRQRYKVSFTRAVGILMSLGGNYAVYNVNKGLIKWHKYGEEKFRLLMEDILRNNLKEDRKKIDSNSAIMFGKDINTAIDILESNDKRTDNMGFEILSFDNTFRSIHFLTLDDNGEKQLKIITKRNWKDLLKKAMFDEDIIAPKNYPYECDAVVDDKRILLFLDSDIGRLRRFKELKYDVSLDNMEVICFPFQEKIVKKYIPGIETVVVDIDVVMNMLDIN